MMKILYISSTSTGMRTTSIYYDLMQKFVEEKHDVFCIFAQEKREGLDTQCFIENSIEYIGVKTGNITKNSNLVSKGVATLRIDGQFLKAIKKNLHDMHFDLVLYSTPPITFTKTLQYFKKKGIRIYLMLKDIFPQNAVDLQMFPKNGVIHKFFLRKEQLNYHLADYIGVMSPANYEFILHNHPNLGTKLRILPNSISIKDKKDVTKTKVSLGLPENDVLFLYGGNIGKPQSPEFIIACIEEMELITGGKFLICGWGSETYKIVDFITNNDIKNTIYLGQKDVITYNEITSVCDVGLIFLDYRFTIPNFPQRLLSYLQESKPVICATDNATDIGAIAVRNHFGVSVPSNNSALWASAVKDLIQDKKLRDRMGNNGFNYLNSEYNVDKAYNSILEHIDQFNPIENRDEGDK